MFHNNEKDYESKLTKEVIRDNFRIVSEMEPVKVIYDNCLDWFDGDTANQIKKYLQSIGGEVVSEYGIILLSNKSAKSILNHRFSKLKACGIGAIKEVVENGKCLYYKRKYKGRNNDRLNIAAPIIIEMGAFKGEYVMGVAIDVSPTTNRAQLIELVLDNIKGESYDFPISIKVPTQVEDSPYMLTLLQQVIDVKNGKLTLDQVTAIGIDSK